MVDAGKEITFHGFILEMSTLISSSTQLPPTENSLQKKKQLQDTHTRAHTMSSANSCEFLVNKVHEVAKLEDYRLNTSKPNNPTLHKIFKRWGLETCPSSTCNFDK